MPGANAELCIYERLLGRYARFISRVRVWHRWSLLIAVAALVGLRTNVRQHNLFDFETEPHTKVPEPEPGVDVRMQRTADGSYNDLGRRWMGMANTGFGRNVPIADAFGELPSGLYEPNPRL